MNCWLGGLENEKFAEGDRLSGVRSPCRTPQSAALFAVDEEAEAAPTLIMATPSAKILHPIRGAIFHRTIALRPSETSRIRYSLDGSKTVNS